MPAMTNAQITANLNARVSPTTSSEIIGTLPAGTRINIISTILPDIWWARIDYPLEGYLSNNYISRDPVPPTPATKAALAALDELIKKIGAIKDLLR